MIRALSFAAALAGVATAAQAAEVNPWWEHFHAGAQMVGLPDGRKIALFCEGKGAPVVVLESGLGGSAASWRKVQDEIAATTRVCSYDRSGLGRSSPATGARDAGALANDLHAVLQAAKVPGPYVLVGHSLGGYTTRLFAGRHPAEVAGLVLVDPSSEDQGRRFAEVAPAAAKLDAGQMAALKPCADPNRSPEVTKRCVTPPPADMPPAFAKAYLDAQGPGRFAASQAEFADFEAGGKAVTAERKPLGDLPLVILTAAKLAIPPGGDPAEAAAAQALWIKMHDETATLSTRGVNLIVQNTGHNIQTDQPAAVITAVGGVVATVRAKGPANSRR